MKEVYTLADLEDWQQLADDHEPPIRLGVFGSPVAHSRSPEMQNAALAACGLPMQYARFEIAAEELARAFELARAVDFVGVNLTIPHKIVALGLVDAVDDFARSAGAVNTVRFERGAASATNTDGPGFAAAIHDDFGVALRGLRVVVLGAGGAARAIAMQCAHDGCGGLMLANRTAARAQQLAADVQQAYGAVVEVVSLSDHAVRGADLLVNTTSVGLRASDPPLLSRGSIRRDLMVYDTVYGTAATPLLVAARDAGARNANGLSMLLHQGALAFQTWFDCAAPLREMAGALGV